MWVFGYAWKINFPKMLFNWPCVLVGLTRKWFEVKIFTSNHFRTHAQREREIAPRPRHEPRAQSLSTSYPSTSPTNPEPRAIRLHTLRLRHLTSTSNRTQIAPFDFAGKPKAQITPSTSPRSHPRISPITLITLRSHPKITPRQHRSHWDRNWEMVGFWWIWPDLVNFFWLGFVSVFIYWEMVLYICLEAKKMWGTRRKWVFYIIFSNTTKH